jgi:predicted nucleic acid-binding protein
MVLVDSDIVIEVNRGRDQGILKAWNDLSDAPDTVAYSPVAVAELWHGVRPAEQETLIRLFDVLTCLPVNAEIGRTAGEYLSRYYCSHGLLLSDALIAATASVHAATLWTRNRRHFPMKDFAFFSGSVP